MGCRNRPTAGNLVRPQGRARQGRVSPDGKRVVTASFDGTARIWNADSGQWLATLTGHQGIVWDAAFSPDGKRIVTASADNSVRVWDAITGEPLVVLTGSTDWVFTAAFSPDGTHIVTASWDGNARMYVADLPDLLKWAKTQLPVNSGQ